MAVPALTCMDPFAESELFDEDIPAASPLSIGGQHDPVRPSDGWRALVPALARAACAIGLLVALLVVRLAAHATRTRPQPPAPNTRAEHGRHRPTSLSRHQSQRFTNPDRKYGVRVMPRKPVPRVQQTVASTPSHVTQRPSRVASVGSQRPTSEHADGYMGQFIYLGR